MVGVVLVAIVHLLQPVNELLFGDVELVDEIVVQEECIANVEEGDSIRFLVEFENRKVPVANIRQNFFDERMLVGKILQVSLSADSHRK